MVAPRPDPAGSPGEFGVATEVKLLAVTVAEGMTFRGSNVVAEMTPNDVDRVSRSRRPWKFGTVQEIEGVGSWGRKRPGHRLR